MNEQRIDSRHQLSKNGLYCETVKRLTDLIAPIFPICTCCDSKISLGAYSDAERRVKGSSG